MCAAWVREHTLAGINASAFSQTPLPSLVDARFLHFILGEREGVAVRGESACAEGER